MRNTSSHDELESLARRRARAKLGWFAHATVYLVVNAGLIALSFANGRSWAVFPLMGWGLGLVLHGVAVWLLAPGGQFFERLVERERARLAGTHGDPW
ncbi:2TM domain-containing protein [Variovorax sp. J22R133]|uniref:2TM domain-containing protein n=1 Tax=Variovorax brevis TaxID=3053503 RepID=UPI002574E3FF|nr:2TM domain-containing protein [Variovorax sp. J22R133]MDM0113344.1 2TM domain-containing protein [Variovorax sp. J22R133]